MSIRKILASLSLGIACIAPGSVMAEDKGMYLSTGWGLGKIGDLNMGTNTGTFIGVLRHEAGLEYDIGLGYDFGERYRVDVTFGQTGQNYENSSTPAGYVDTIISTVSINGYLDMPTQSNLTPFVGLGVGSTEVEVYGGTASGSSFSAILGGAYAISNKVDLEAKLTYRTFSELDFGWVKVTGSNNTSGLLGVRVKL
tara:strand:+ start:7270 stop:7860 length:591 start_codon:yes stop_codon:yes gene_type:complete